MSDLETYKQTLKQNVNAATNHADLHLLLSRFPISKVQAFLVSEIDDLNEQLPAFIKEDESKSNDVYNSHPMIDVLPLDVIPTIFSFDHRPEIQTVSNAVQSAYDLNQQKLRGEKERLIDEEPFYDIEVNDTYVVVQSSANGRDQVSQEVIDFVGARDSFIEVGGISLSDTINNAKSGDRIVIQQGDYVMDNMDNWDIQDIDLQIIGIGQVRLIKNRHRRKFKIKIPHTDSKVLLKNIQFGRAEGDNGFKMKLEGSLYLEECPLWQNCALSKTDKFRAKLFCKNCKLFKDFVVGAPHWADVTFIGCSVQDLDVGFTLSNKGLNMNGSTLKLVGCTIRDVEEVFAESDLYFDADWWLTKPDDEEQNHHLDHVM